MLNLIKAETKKILKKKSFLIVTIIFILYAILLNFLYKNLNAITQTTTYDIASLKEENSHLDLSNEEDLALFITNLTRLEIEDLKKDYPNYPEQFLIENYLYHDMYNLINAKYHDTKAETLTKLETAYNSTLALIQKGDWQSFAKNNLTKYQTELTKTTDKQEITRLNYLISIEEYRLANQIVYDNNNYLHNALETVKLNLTEYLNLQNKTNLTKEEQERYTYLKGEMAENKYILEHKLDVHNNENLKSVFANFSEEFGLFILIYVILIFGPLVSEEFNKGTIKNLLIKPYKRSTILLAKLLTGLLFIPFVIILMLTLELLIGGIILGFNSLNIPILIYDSTKNILVVYSLFKYVLSSLVSILPMYLTLGILAFSLSTVTSSTSAAITITFLFYLIGNVISNLALVYNFKIFNYFVSLHWDFGYLITKVASPYHFKVSTSLIVLGLYISVMLCLTFIYFHKKDVKNL